MSKTIIAVMGDAGAGKSVFSKLGQLHGWNCQEMGVGLKLIETHSWNHFQAMKINGTKSFNIDDIYWDNSDYQVLIEDWNTVNEFYREVITFSDYCKILKQAIEWFSNNDVIIHNGIRRNSLQFIGTEIMRNTYGKDVHIKGIINWLSRQGGDKWIIESVRFLNEIELLRSMSDTFIPVVIQRENRELLKNQLSVHSSEIQWKEWLATNNDTVRYMENVGTIGNYISKVNNFFEEL